MSIQEDTMTTVDVGGEEARLEALLDRLGELESGLRDELAAQVDRAEHAEAALAEAEARAVRAEVAGRVSVPPVGPPPSAPPAATDGVGAADREALATALREVRAYLERRRSIEAEIVTIAQDALAALRQHGGASPVG